MNFFLPCILIKKKKKKDFIYFLERGREGEKGEKHQLAASCMPPTRDLVRNPDMCPDWESNQRVFSLQDYAQPTDLHHSPVRALCLLLSSSLFTLHYLSQRQQQPLH